MSDVTIFGIACFSAIVLEIFMMRQALKGKLNTKSNLQVEKAKKNGWITEGYLIHSKFHNNKLLSKDESKDYVSRSAYAHEDYWEATYEYKVNGKKYQITYALRDVPKSTKTIYYDGENLNKKIYGNKHGFWFSVAIYSPIICFFAIIILLKIILKL